MTTPALLPCDGCGQLADSAHISRRLQRLAWATRFRPLHIQFLLLSAIPPARDDDFLYNPNSSFQGESAMLLNAIPLSTAGKSPETVLTEFQKLGLMLIHILECPLNPSTPSSGSQSILEKHLPAAIARIRRSLKPKRLLLLSSDLQPLAPKLHQARFDFPVFPAFPGAFLTSSNPPPSDLLAFRSALALPNPHTF